MAQPTVSLFLERMPVAELVQLSKRVVWFVWCWTLAPIGLVAVVSIVLADIRELRTPAAARTRHHTRYRSARHSA